MTNATRLSDKLQRAIMQLENQCWQQEFEGTLSAREMLVEIIEQEIAAARNNERKVIARAMPYTRNIDT